MTTSETGDDVQQLVDAAQYEGLIRAVAERVTAAVLRRLADLQQSAWDDDVDWPDPDDLRLLADQADGGLPEEDQ